MSTVRMGTSSAPVRSVADRTYGAQDRLPRYLTPLRYPGGKQRLGAFFASTLETNGLLGSDYIEPFAGGAGVALYLLRSGAVASIHLNDVDRSVFALWYAVARLNEALCARLRRTPVNVKEWDEQKQVQREKESAPLLDLGMSTLFLNRTNRSGILRGGMIGGRAQAGKWRLDVRFNKAALIERIMSLRHYTRHIHVSRLDAAGLLRTGVAMRPRAFCYLDPPYVRKSPDLYLSHYTNDDHALLARAVKDWIPGPWIITYDDCAHVRSLYATYSIRKYSLAYTADRRRFGRELMILPRNLQAPIVP